MNAFDLNIYNFVFSFNSTVFTLFMRVISSFASATVIIATLICILVLFKNKKVFLNFAGIALISKIINVIIKNIVKRPRPDLIFRLSFESGYSFPSAHTMVATCFYGFIIYLILKHVKNKKVKSFSTLLLSILIFLIGISRIYLGVHYATDVIAGLIFGIIVLVLFIKFIYLKHPIDFSKIELNITKEPKKQVDNKVRTKTKVKTNTRKNIKK